MRIQNESLAREVMQTIIDNPDRWNQDVWVEEYNACHTAYCFAGWALILSGVSLEKNPHKEGHLLIQGIPADAQVGFTVPDLAQELLDIESDAIADELFDGLNDLDDLKHLLYSHTDGKVDFVGEPLETA